MTTALRPGHLLVLCGLFGACSESPPSPMQDSGAGGGGMAGQVAGSGGAGQGGRSGSPAGGAGSAGFAADGGRAGSTTSAEVERSVVAADDSPDISDTDYATFRAQFAGFGLELGQKLATTEMLTTENVVYSPLSAAYALAMSYVGARGQTGAEMKSVLRDGFMDSATYHSGSNRLARELATRALTEMEGNRTTRKVELHLADALFLERTARLQPAFLDVLAREYDSGVQRLDFLGAHEAARMTINDWVADQTQDKIVDLLPMGSVDAQTPFVLVNALYFYGVWRTPFTVTSPADFHTLGGDTKPVHMLRDFSMLTGYASSTDFSLAELPYAGEHLSMIIVLPADGKFESVRNMVSDAWLEQAASSLEPSLLDLSLPKFKLTVGSFSLKAGLEALGMKQAFTDAADFSGMAPGVKIADVLQKCFIAVNEAGTEAAAATAIIGAPTSAPIEQPIPFLVDRPFLFFIRDNNGITLFSGQVVDPSQAQ